MPAGRPQDYDRGDLEQLAMLHSLLGRAGFVGDPGRHIIETFANMPGTQSARVQASQSGDIETVRLLEALMGRPRRKPQTMAEEPEEEQGFDPFNIFPGLTGEGGALGGR